MISENELNKSEITVKIDRESDNNVCMLFPELDNVSVNLSNSSTADIEKLYETIFNYMIEKKTNIEFHLDDDNTDLFQEVANDIIIQMNSELDKSEEKLVEVINLF